ncbi:MAG: hypothetical protein Q9165_007537 [Trypethelium subeluteriae]
MAQEEEEESAAPPLPDEAPPDDGWEALWDANTQAYYFYNRFSGISTWDNPRVPEATSSHDAPSSTTITPSAPGTSDSPHPSGHSQPSEPPPAAGGYNPKIHGDYDPTADYARVYSNDTTGGVDASSDPTSAAAAIALGIGDPGAEAEDAAQYLASAHFNRFTGRFQDTANVNPERHSDESKARRQLNAFYDADAQANSHDGKSLKAERQGRKLTKQEVKAFNEKRKKRKEEKRRAFFRD